MRKLRDGDYKLSLGRDRILGFLETNERRQKTTVTYFNGGDKATEP